MEQKHIWLSALSVGVAVGLGLAPGQIVSKWTGGYGCMAGDIMAEMIEHELFRMVVDGKQSKVTFDEFPYYLR